MSEVTYISWTPGFATDLPNIEGVWNDIFQARTYMKQAIRAVEERSDQLLFFEPLTVAALMSYFRCFSGGKRPKRLDPLNLSEPLLNAHKRLKAIRDLHFAHPINQYEVHNVTLSVANLGTDEARATSVSSNTVSNAGLDPSDAANFISLCDHWLIELQSERSAAVDALMIGASKLTSFELNNLAQTTGQEPNDDPFRHR